jgi:hypothetical protein
MVGSSNSIKIVLLFVVASFYDAAFAFYGDYGLLSDTLIIDTDTIYIEQEEVTLISDSTIGQAVASKPMRKQLWCVSLKAGVNNTLASVQSNSNSLQLLNDFVGFRSLPQPNLCVGGEFGMRIHTIKGNRGSIELTASVGYSLNKIKIRHASIKAPSLLQQDSVRQFLSDSNELLMSYFTVTEPPDIGEEDTLSIPLNRPMLVYNTHDLVASLRATYSRGFKFPRFFIETGVARRFVQLSKKSEPFYLLNEDGEWSTLDSEGLDKRNLLVPHFAIGIERNFAGEFSSANRFVTLGASVNASIPSATFSDNIQLSIDVKSIGVMIFARSFF